MLFNMNIISRLEMHFTIFEWNLFKNSPTIFALVGEGCLTPSLLTIEYTNDLK